MKNRIYSIYALALVAAALFISCGNERHTAHNNTNSDKLGNYITVDQLHKVVEAGKDIYLVDVRTFREFLNKRLSFADVLIPFDSLEIMADRLPKDKNSEIFLFCRTGRRSRIAFNILKEMGYNNLHNVRGGIVAWEDAGYETISGPVEAK
ncbi:MAG: rhodanese-like domain-containing protein [Candidatus Zixiibacteriota bacterium]